MGERLSGVLTPPFDYSPSGGSALFNATQAAPVERMEQPLRQVLVSTCRNKGFKRDPMDQRAPAKPRSRFAERWLNPTTLQPQLIDPCQWRERTSNRAALRACEGRKLNGI